jgi:L-lactate dehydrogenase complex protein LldF
MRHWREREFERHLTPSVQRFGLKIWGFFAKHPGLYSVATRAAMSTLAWLGKDKGRFASLPLAKGWTEYRDLPAPQGDTFQAQWRKRQQEAHR